MKNTGNDHGARPRAWDAYDAYLFDIDGTLLTCHDAVHYFAFCSVLESLSGRPLNLDGVTAHGNTDLGILRDALRLALVPDEAWRGRLDEIRAAMCSHVEAHKNDLRITVMPAVTAILGHLLARGAVLGVATGNLEGIGTLKLQHCGLLRYFAVGGYSDAYEYRSDVFRAARDRAHAVAGKHASICVVGDTPADVDAARANGLDVIAVATGIYSFEQLATAGPDLCVHSLAELALPR